MSVSCVRHTLDTRQTHVRNTLDTYYSLFITEHLLILAKVASTMLRSSGRLLGAGGDR